MMYAKFVFHFDIKSQIKMWMSNDCQRRRTFKVNIFLSAILEVHDIDVDPHAGHQVVSTLQYVF